MTSTKNNIQKTDIGSNSFLEPEFITDVVHKIKNGLGGIAGFTGLLERDLNSDDPKYRIVQRIYNGVLGVNEIVVALMNLSITPELSIENVQLTALVKEIWSNELQEENGSLNNEIKTLFSGKKCQVRGDRFVLQKIIYSIFKVIKFSNCIIKEIDISPIENQAVLSMMIQTNDKEEEICFSKNKKIYDVMKKCEPVEIRLNCAVLIKMLSIHGGEIKINKIDDNNFTIKIFLNER